MTDAVLALGVDLIEIERIERAVARFGDRFLSRVYTLGELAHCKGRAPALAARFAAKEAVAKALGTGIGDVAWREIEVINDDRGRPWIVLHGRARALAEQQGLSHLTLTLSHTRAYAIAFVVAT